MVGVSGGGESGLGLFLGNWLWMTLLEQGWLDQITSRHPFQPQPFCDSGSGPNSAVHVALRKCLGYLTALVPHFCWGDNSWGCLWSPPSPQKNLDSFFSSPSVLVEVFFITLALGEGLELKYLIFT